MHFCRRFTALVLVAIGSFGCGSGDPAGAGSNAGSGGTSAAGAPGTGGVTASGTGGATNGGGAGTVSGGGSGQAAGAAGMSTGGASTGGAAGAGGAASTGGATGMAAGGAGDLHPLLALLPKFTAADVPVRGPMEAALKNPPGDKGTVPTLPGNGLAQHPLLYVGENYNRILMTNQGKVIWSYDTQGGYELDDVWMLSNGNILYAHMTYIEEITPTKQVVWHYVPPGNAEIHSCQPIGLDKVLIALNADPMPKLQLIDIKTSAIELEHVLPEGASTGPHGQIRRMRKTATGTYLVGFLTKAKVVEYDQDFTAIRTIAIPQPWSVARLHNGNTLILSEGEATCKEFDAMGNIVWSLQKSSLMIQGAQIGGGTQTCERLASGNTAMFMRNGPGNVQLVEVAKDKSVVWALEDWNDLGDATTAQFLDEPGIPEVPGSTEH